MTDLSYTTLADDYTKLWETMEPRPAFAKACEYAALKIIDGRARYEAVSASTGVPWYVVGLIHQMEAGGRWSCHLHNGDPLSGRTVTEPKGRPKVWAAPFQWEASAIDALCFDKLDQITAWPIARICHALEAFNGWGYRKHHPEVSNPYLWSGSNHYVRGKYTSDKVWDATCVSAQPGAMPILRQLVTRVPEIGLASPLLTAMLNQAVVTPEPLSPDSFRKATPPAPVVEALATSRTISGQLAVVLGTGVTWAGAAFDNTAQVALDAVHQVTKLDGLKSLAPSSKWIGTGVIGLGVGLAIFARIDAARKGKVG